MTDSNEIIFVLNSMRKHITNSLSDSEIIKASRQNEAIDYAISLIRKEQELCTKLEVRG